MKRMTHLVLVALLLCLAARSPAYAAATAPGLDAELLKFAPEGTWCVQFVDFKALRASPVGRLTPFSRDELLRRLQKARAKALFHLPFEPPLGLQSQPGHCAIVRFEGSSREEIQQRLGEEIQQLLGGDLTKTTVQGQDAYKITAGFLLMVADDNTVLAGDTPDSLAAILNGYKAGKGTGLAAPLQDLVNPLSGDTVYVAAALPMELQSMVSADAREQLPPYLAGARGGALGINLTDGLRVKAMLRLSNAEQAQHAMSGATEAVAKLKARLEESESAVAITPFGPPPLVTALLDKLMLSTDGADVKLSIALSKEELQELAAVTTPAMDSARMAARKATSQHNLHNISLGIAMYRLAHEGQYPPNLEATFEEGYLETEEVFRDPSDTAPVQRGKKGLKYSYEYVGLIPKNAPPDIIICYTRKGIYPDGRNVLYLDMAVQWVSEDELHDPEGPLRTSLRACYTALMERFGDQLSEEQKARLRKFYEIKE